MCQEASRAWADIVGGDAAVVVVGATSGCDELFSLLDEHAESAIDAATTAMTAMTAMTDFIRCSMGNPPHFVVGFRIGGIRQPVRSVDQFFAAGFRLRRYRMMAPPMMIAITMRSTTRPALWVSLPA